MQLTTY
jgi:hypothetical protein